MSVLAGIDYSMTCPSICIHDNPEEDEQFSIDNCSFFFATDSKKYAKRYLSGKITGSIMESKYTFENDIARYMALADLFMELIETEDVTEVGLEDYAFAAKGQVFNIGENTAMLKSSLYQNQIPFFKFAPSQIKKFATGKGNANKNAMYEAFYNETAWDLKNIMSYNKKSIDSPIGDIVDSYYICKYLFHWGVEGGHDGNERTLIETIENTI